MGYPSSEHTCSHLTSALVIAMISLAAAGTSGGATLEVCASGCPYSSIQAAINAAGTGDTVLVHDGTYTEVLNTLGKAITLRSVNGAATTTVDANGVDRVLSILNGETESTVVQGFTFTGGNADPYVGGAVIVSYASPVIRACVLTGNSAPEAGGLFIWYASPTISGCTISNNTVTASGNTGGILISGPGSEPTITDCVISNNTGDGLDADEGTAPTLRRCTISANTGNGISAYTSDILVDDCTISNHMFERGVVLSHGEPLITNSRILNNRNLEDGGGMWLGATNATVRDCVFSGNLARYGSAIEIRDAWGGSHPLIQRCLLTGNGSPSTYEGGALYISAVQARVESCTVSGNWSIVGGGIYVDGWPDDTEAPTIVNSTISSNYGQASNYGGAGIYVETIDATTVVKNCVVWGNYARGGSGSSHQIEVEEGGTIDVRYSDVEGGWAGPGNQNANPEFVTPVPADQAPTTAGDYHLLATSDCIDAGTANDAAETDIDNGLRPWGPGIDQGSDEYGATSEIFSDGFESGGTSAWSSTL